MSNNMNLYSISLVNHQTLLRDLANLNDDQVQNIAQAIVNNPEFIHEELEPIRTFLNLHRHFSPDDFEIRVYQSNNELYPYQNRVGIGPDFLHIVEPTITTTNAISELDQLHNEYNNEEQINIDQVFDQIIIKGDVIQKIGRLS